MMGSGMTGPGDEPEDITNLRIGVEVSLDEARARCLESGKVFYAALTCWFGWWPMYTTHSNICLPCDPRGSVLYESDKVSEFFAAAEARAGFYGEHGLRTFLLAFHGCLVTVDGRPTSLRRWDSYERVLKRED
jgi:hypothetical protein